MSDKPTIVVTNGTAGEGYWTVYYLLKTGLFNVRATARRLESPLVAKLKAIEFNGNRCEVVQAANEDEAALSKAFAQTASTARQSTTFMPNNMSPIIRPKWHRAKH